MDELHLEFILSRPRRYGSAAFSPTALPLSDEKEREPQ